VVTSNLRARACVCLLVSVGLVASVMVSVASSAGASPSWSIVTSPSPAESVLNGVSCVTASDCFAVGGAGGGRMTLVERWDGTSWSVVASPNPGTEANWLSGVSCVSATDCVAVGSTITKASETPYKTLVEQWDGIGWSVVASPNPISNRYGGYLQAVSCSAATSCFAVGTYILNDDNSHTLVERWDGLRWSIVPSPNGTGIQANSLLSVSCPTAQFCVAVGPADNTHGEPVPLVQRWNGTRWSNDTTVAPADLIAVSCATATSCIAVGTKSERILEGQAEQWNGTRWSIVPAPGPGLVNLTCVSATNCTAVGANLTWQYTGVHVPVELPQTLVKQWNGTAWTITPTPNPYNTALRAVSCPTATDCVAVGSLVHKAATLFEQYTTTTAPPPIVAIAATPSGLGSWLAASDGSVSTVGEARFYGPIVPLDLNKPIVGMAAPPFGHGYWLVASDGGIFSFGDARFYGSTGAKTLNKPIVGIAATPSGHGYWLVASDGGIFSFGDARFYGSTGAKTLNKPIVGIAATPSGHGYWLVASDGGIFTFGNAPFHGSTGGLNLTGSIVGLTATSARGHYLLAESDQQTFAF